MLKKYSITALFSLLLIFTAFTGGGSAQAQESVMTPEIAVALADVEKVNAEIDAEIAKVQEKVAKMYADYIYVKTNSADSEAIAEEWNKYDVKAEAEILKLSLKTESMTLKGMAKATSAGLNVKIDWINVIFADREREIDPIKVMDW